MNNAQWRFFAFNQFLFGKGFDSLPSACRDVVAEDKPLWEKAQRAGKTLKLNTLEKLFLSFLRVPDYGFCLTIKHDIMTLSRVIDTVHEHDIPLAECSHWAPAIVAGVQVDDFAYPHLRDGVLYLPSKYDDGKTDLDGTLRAMFGLRCWGSNTPNESCKQFVKSASTVVNPAGDVNMTAELFTSLLTLAAETGVRPNTFVQTVFVISDLLPTLQETGAVCWWSNTDNVSVSLMLPRGKGDKLAHAVVPFTEISKMYGDNKEVLQSMTVRGQNIVYGG